MDTEVLAFLQKHLQSILTNDWQTYLATVAEDLSVYEWWLTPHRIDGLPFHEFMITADATRNARLEKKELIPPRYDLANLRIQRYGDTAIACYTLLSSSSHPEGERVEAHNESRVMVKLNGEWKVVHVHKSPAWHAPHEAN